jgi:hypothetical protein
MWRDAPIVAFTFFALAVIMMVGWHRAGKTGAKEDGK